MNNHLELEIAKFFQSLGLDSHQIMIAMMKLESGNSFATALYEALELRTRINKEKENG